MRGGNLLLQPIVVFWTGITLWISRFFFVPIYLMQTQYLGFYPTQGDSIGIPALGNAFLTIVGLPFVYAGLRRNLKDSPTAHRTWLGWCAQRSKASWGWSVIFITFALLSVSSFLTSLQIAMPVLAVADLLWCYFWLAMRAVAISKLFNIPRPPVLSGVRLEPRRGDGD